MELLYSAKPRAFGICTLYVFEPVPRLIFLLPQRKQNESHTITKDRGERGKRGHHKYLFARPENLCNSMWICQVIFKCLNDLYGRSWAPHLSTVSLDHLCINIYGFIHITYSWQHVLSFKWIS